MSVDNLQKLYNNISKDYDLPEYNQFKKDMENPEKSAKLHETLVKDNWEVPEYDKFSSDLGLKKKEPTESDLESFKSTMSGTSKMPKEYALEVPSIQGKEVPKKSKIDTEIDKWYSDRGGMTPTDKFDTFNSKIKEVDAKYQGLAKNITTEEQRKSVADMFEKEVSDLAYNTGLMYDKEKGKVALIPNDIKTYEEVYKNALDRQPKDKKLTSVGEVFQGLDRGFIQAGLGIREIAGSLLLLDLSSKYKDYNATQREAQEIRSFFDMANSKFDASVSNALENKDYKGALGRAIIGTAESAPSLMLMFTNPQYGLLAGGLLSANEKDKALIKDESVSTIARGINVVTTGLLEIATEKLTTAPMIEKSVKALENIGEQGLKEAVTKTFQSTIQTAARRMGNGLSDATLEASSEALNQLGQNYVEKITVNPDKNVTDGVVDAFAIGFVTAGVIKSPNIAIESTELAKDLAVSAFAKTPKNMPMENRINSSVLIAEKEAMQQENKGIDKNLQKNVDNEVSVIDNAIKLTKEPQTIKEQVNYLNQKINEELDGSYPDVIRLGELEKALESVEQKVDLQGGKKLQELNKNIESLRDEREGLYQGEQTEIQIQKDGQREKQINKQLLTSLKEKQAIRNEIYNKGLGDIDSEVSQMINQDAREEGINKGKKLIGEEIVPKEAITKPVVEDNVKAEQTAIQEKEGLKSNETEVVENKDENVFNIREKELTLQQKEYERIDKENKGRVAPIEMGGTELRRKDVEGGLGETPRYVVRGSDRISGHDPVNNYSIPKQEAAEISKSLPNAIFDDSFEEVKSAEKFSESITKSKTGNKYSASVFIYPTKEYKSSKLFLTKDGKAGVAVTKEGDIISVFSHGEGKGRTPQLLINAIKEGGVSLDHYDTRLTSYYAQFGFVPVAKVKWNDEFAPKDWNKETFKGYNNGEPDVIAMAYHGGDPNTLYQRVGKFADIKDLLDKAPYIETWDEAKRLQKEYVDKLKQSKVQPTKVTSPVEESQGTVEKNRRMGDKALASKVLNPEVKDKIKENGITYFVRGDAIVTEEAQEIAKIYTKENNRDGLKALILDRNNGIRGDTRTELSVAYAEETQKLADKAKTKEEKQSYEQDIADVYISEMESATDVARDLRSKARWQSVLGNNPDVLVEYKKRSVRKANQEFLNENSKDIKTAKQIIDEYVGSEEFKKKIEEVIKQRGLDNTVNKKERGKAKIANALDKLANLSGAKKNFVADNDVKASQEDIASILIELASGILDVGVANIDELIHKIKVATREHLSPRVIDDFKERIVKETDAENNLTKKFHGKEFLEERDIKKLVDKIYSKALNANKGDLKRILLESIDKILQGESLDSDAFKELYAKAAGLPYVDDAIANEIRESQTTINDARNIRNNLESLLDEAIAEQAKTNPDVERLHRLEEEIAIQRDAYKESYSKAERANANISKIFAPEMTGAQKVSAGIQAGLMGPTTFFLNPLANIVSQIPRTIKMYVEWGLDFGMYGVGTIKENWLNKIDKEKNPSLYKVVNSLANKEMTRNAPVFSKYYLKKLPSATKQAFEDIIKGQTPDDAYIREIARGMHPMEAAMRVYEQLSGKRKKEFDKLLGDVWESTLGVYAEGVFRLLNLGDKPFRLATMFARLNEIASIKGLKGYELEKFLLSPDEASLADAIEMGKKATFQQDTQVSKKILQFKSWANDVPSTNPISSSLKGLATVLMATQIPFVKTLVNIANEGAKYTLPWYSGTLGTISMSKGDRKGALDNYAATIVATVIGLGMTELIAAGIMTLGTGGREEDDDEYSKKKVQKAEYVGDYGAYRLNISAGLRYLLGGDATWQDDDISIDYRGLGLIGIAATAKAEAYRGLTQKETREQAIVDHQLGLAWGALQGVTAQPFFTGPATFLTAFMEGGNALDNWAQNTMSALRAAAIPNTYVAINKYRDNKIRETREKYVDKTRSAGWEQIKNRLSSDLKPDTDLPVKISIYGEDVERFKDKALWNLFDPLKIKTHESDYAFKIFEVYNRTKDESIFPAYPKASIKDEKIGKEYVKLDAPLYNEYAKMLLSTKAIILKAVVNSPEWDKMTDDTRVMLLNRIHDTYMRQGGVGDKIKDLFIVTNIDKLKKLETEQVVEEVK